MGSLIDEVADLRGLAANLPDLVSMRVGTGHGDSFVVDTTILGKTVLDGKYASWYMNAQNTQPGSVYSNVQVYSSYENLPEGLLQSPENVDKVNYIINQGYQGEPSPCGGTYTHGDVQKAILELIVDNSSTSGPGYWNPCRADEIYQDALANGHGFEPDCGECVAVILVPSNGTREIIISQVTLGEDEVAPCLPVYEYGTAWASGTKFNTEHRGFATHFTCSCTGISQEKQGFLANA